MNKDFLKKLIKYGCCAPSGDNSQPWKFTITGDNNILLYSLPFKDNPILNIHEGGSFLSDGAAILNIKIAAQVLGYEVDIIYFPDKNNDTLIAKLSFTKNQENLNKEWINYIEERSTNRRLYSKVLPEELVIKLLKNTEKNNCKVKLFKNQNVKDFIANEISLSEEVILETEELHKLLFKDVVWTQKDELKKRHGLFVKTLEFNPIQAFVFWLCRKWKTISVFNKIGFAHFVASQNRKIYKASGVLGFIIIPNIDKLSYVHAGEVMQQVWLNAESLGLGFQPVTGLFFLHERILTFKNDPLLLKSNKKILKAYNLLKNIADLSGEERIVISFRIGVSKKTSARSSRLEPNIILE